MFDRPSHVYVVAADGTGRPRNLTPGEFQHDGVAWLADSSGVVTSAQRHDTWDLDFAARSVRRRRSTVRSARSPSQTGSYAAPVGVARRHHGRLPRLRRPEHVPAERARRRRPRSQAAAHRGSRQRSTARSRPPPAASSPRWVDATTLLGTAEDRGQTHVDRVRTDGGAPGAVTNGAITVKAIDAAGGTVALTRQLGRQRRRSVRAATAARRGGSPRSPTATAAGRRADVGALRGARAPTAPTRSMRGSCVPSVSTRSTQYPVILNVHGGPHTQYGETFFDEAQFQAAAGFVVLMSNPRGGSRPRAGVGPGDPRAEAPGGARHRLGRRRRRRRAGRARHGARPLPVLRPEPGRHAGRQLRRLHGDPAGRPVTATGSRRSAASVPSTTCSPRSGPATSARSSASSTGPTHIDDPERVRAACRRSGTSATSRARC